MKYDPVNKILINDAAPNWSYTFKVLDNVERHIDKARVDSLNDLKSIKKDIDKLLDHKDVPDDVKRMLVERYDELYKKIRG